jgi:16S rRNA C967 or C1407 C5-methylase (RsmB/RsmF family)/NOL1/NOP2/fmu family ribosome biogenesis protein
VKELPRELLHNLQTIKGFDEEPFIEAHRHAAPTSVRLHPVKGASLFKDEERVQWCSMGRYLAQRPVFTLDPLFHAGAYYVQEASSMFLEHMVCSLLPDRNNLRVLDLCAAPGGKSTLLASLLDDSSLLISNEVIRSRASILEENVIRWGYTNNWVTGNDPRDFAKLPGYFDFIVVDAPCSGSGLFRKDERALDEWSEANVALCSQRQQRILADVWPALKQNGILIYATCSYSPQEDEEILDWLMESFDIEPLGVTVPETWGMITAVSGKGAKGYRFFPDKVKGEGFFIAAFQKKEATAALRQPKFKAASDKRIQQQAAHLLNDKQYTFFQGEKETYNAIYPLHEADWHLLKEAVYLRKLGLNIGNPSQKEWLPSHDIALSIDRSKALAAVALDKDRALRFMKKEEISMPALDKAWYLVTFEGAGLGWIKSIGTRFNNYLPKHWRIRMDLPPADWA